MRRFNSLLGVAAIALAMAGCDSEETPSGTTVTPPAVPSRTDTSAAEDALGTAASDASKQAQSTVDQARTSANDAAASSAVPAEAQKLLDQTLQYIKENKYDLAEKSLAQLEGMKDKLPASFVPQIENARKMLNSAKAAGNVKVPGM